MATAPPQRVNGAEASPPSALTTRRVTATPFGNRALSILPPPSVMSVGLVTCAVGHGVASPPMKTLAPGWKPEPPIWSRNGRLSAVTPEITGGVTDMDGSATRATNALSVLPATQMHDDWKALGVVGKF